MAGCCCCRLLKWFTIPRMQYSHTVRTFKPVLSLLSFSFNTFIKQIDNKLLFRQWFTFKYAFIPRKWYISPGNKDKLCWHYFHSDTKIFEKVLLNQTVCYILVKIAYPKTANRVADFFYPCAFITSNRNKQLGKDDSAGKVSRRNAFQSLKIK